MNSEKLEIGTTTLAAWFVVSLFYAYQYILKVMPGIMITDIMTSFDMNTAIFGKFSGIYYIGYSLMHLPVAIMLDRYGPRKIITGCVLVTALGLLPLIYSTHWIYPIAGRFLSGMGASSAILGVFKIIRMKFSTAHFSRMLSLSVTIGLVGAIYGGRPINYLSQNLGYQKVIMLLIGIGLLLAMTVYYVIPNTDLSKNKNKVSDIKAVFSNKKVLLSCMFAGLMIGTLEGFADVWGAIFFRQVYGYDRSLSSTLPSMIYMGMCFGGPVLSLIADKLGNYFTTIIGSGITMIFLFSLLLFSTLTFGALSVSLILLGTCCSYKILAISKASTFVHKDVAGLTQAVANMIIMLFGFIFHVIIGEIVNTLGGTNLSNALVYGLSTIPAALCLGIGGFTYLYFNERKQKEELRLKKS